MSYYGTKIWNYFNIRALRRRISAVASASARLLQKVEAAGPPDPTIGSGRYAPNRGCQRSWLGLRNRRFPSPARFSGLPENKNDSAFQLSHFWVRAKGIEPIRLSAPDPKSGLSTNFNTPAYLGLQMYNNLSDLQILNSLIADSSETEADSDTETQSYIVVRGSEIVPELETMMITSISRIAHRITCSHPEVCKESFI